MAGCPAESDFLTKVLVGGLLGFLFEGGGTMGGRETCVSFTEMSWQLETLPLEGNGVEFDVTLKDYSSAKHLHS